MLRNQVLNAKYFVIYKCEHFLENVWKKIRFIDDADLPFTSRCINFHMLLPEAFMEAQKLVIPREAIKQQVQVVNQKIKDSS